MPNGLLDTIQADPEFSKMSQRDKRILLGEALDRDPDYKALQRTEQSQFRNEVYRRYSDPAITKEAIPAPPKPRAPTVQEGLNAYRQQWLQGSRPDSKPAQSLLMLENNPRSRWNEILKDYKEPSKKAIMQQAVANEKALRAEGRRKRGELGRALGETTIGAMPEAPAPSSFEKGMEKLGYPLSLVTKNALFATGNAIRNTDFGNPAAKRKDLLQQVIDDPASQAMPTSRGKEDVSYNDAVNIKRLQGMNIFDRASELNAQDIRALGRPDLQDELARQYTNKSDVGKILDRVSMMGVNMAADPITLAMGGLGGAANALKMASSVRRGVGAGKATLKQKAMGVAGAATSGVQKAAHAGFTANMIGHGIPQFIAGVESRDAGAAVEGYLSALMGGAGTAPLFDAVANRVAKSPPVQIARGLSPKSKTAKSKTAKYNPNAPIPENLLGGEQQPRSTESPFRRIEPTDGTRTNAEYGIPQSGADGKPKRTAPTEPIATSPLEQARVELESELVSPTGDLKVDRSRIRPLIEETARKYGVDAEDLVAAFTGKPKRTSPAEPIAQAPKPAEPVLSEEGGINDAVAAQMARRKAQRAAEAAKSNAQPEILTSQVKEIEQPSPPEFVATHKIGIYPVRQIGVDGRGNPAYVDETDTLREGTAKPIEPPKVETPAQEVPTAPTPATPKKANEPQQVTDIAMNHPDPIQRLMQGMDAGEIVFQAHPIKGTRAVNQRTGEVFDNANGLLREGQTANRQNYGNALKETMSKKVMADNNAYTRADVERFQSQGYLTDEAFNSYADRWNSSPRVGIPMTRILTDTARQLQEVPAKPVEPPIETAVPTAPKEAWEMTRGEFARAADAQSNTFEPLGTEIDWGTKRGQGKRSGGTVRGPRLPKPQNP